MRKATTTTTAPLPQLQGQQPGEGWGEYGRRAMLFALQLQADVFTGLDNDGLSAGADACNVAMAAAGRDDVVLVACLTALQQALRSRLAGRRAETTRRLQALQATADALPEAPQADAPQAPPPPPQGGSKVRAAAGPKPSAPPAAALPPPVPIALPALALDADAF